MERNCRQDGCPREGECDVMVKVCVINGRPGCGKTTFESICHDFCDYGRPGFSEGRLLAVDICSTVDFVKEIALECGWDGTKTLENRRFLSDLKDLLTHWNDIPYKKILERTKQLSSWASYNYLDWILFVDCREPTEIQKLKERLNATTVLIRRDNVEYDEVSNHADSDVFYYDYDLTIWNNSDIIELENEAKKFIEYMKKEEVPHYVNVD